MMLRERAIELIQNSFTLNKNPLEKAFWLERMANLSDKETQELCEALEGEAKTYALIKQEQLNKEISANNAHLNTLEKLRHKTIPAAIKQSEENYNKAEQVEDILSEI